MAEFGEACKALGPVLCGQSVLSCADGVGSVRKRGLVGFGKTKHENRDALIASMHKDPNCYTDI